MANVPAGSYQTVVLEELRPHPQNPRRGNIDVIAESLLAHGQYRPIVVQRSTGYVLAGNHTLAAARGLGWPTVEVRYVDCDDETATRIMLVDNRTADLGRYDDDALLAVLQSLDDMTGTGWSRTDVDDLDRLLMAAGDPGELSEQFDDLTADDFRQTLRFRMGPDVYERWQAWAKRYGDDVEAFVALLDGAGA